MEILLCKTMYCEVEVREKKNQNHTKSKKTNNTEGKKMNHTDGKKMNHTEGKKMNHTDGKKMNCEDGKKMNHAEGKKMNHAEGKKMNHTDDKELNRKAIRKESWNLAFKRGKKAWISLVAVCIIFSILGVSETSQTSFFDAADASKGTVETVLPDNVSVLENYIVGTSFVSKLHFMNKDTAVALVDSLSKSNTWLIQFLGANAAYFKRNSGEVVVFLLIAGIISFILSFFIQSAALVGKYRYTLETRYSKNVSVGRILSPFHKDTIGNLSITMAKYKLFLVLWSLTIVGGFYKFYQYRFVPFILAENPNLKWKQVRDLSKKMTDGYKWKMFVCDLSCIPIHFLRVIPLCGILVTVPFSAEYLGSLYILLRKELMIDHEDIGLEKAFSEKASSEKASSEKVDSDIVETDNLKNYFIERVFDEKSLVSELEKTDDISGAESEPVYLLKSAALDLPEELKQKRYYTIVEFLYMFFLFSFVGWGWEVCLHIVRNHELVNRGAMYGPWLPIYGSGGVVIIFLLDRFKANKGKFFLMAMGVCGVLEFLSSWILDFFYNSHYWNYKDMLINVNGRICLIGLLMFGLGGMAGVYVLAPKLSEYLRSKDKKKVNLICIILCVAFIADLLCCIIFGMNSGSGVGGSY